MKAKNIKYILAAGVVCCGLSMTSCQDVLDEQPRSQFDPSYFSTKPGIEGGITALYAHLRYIYGNGYYLNSCETGTDEYTYAQSADGNFKDADLSGVGQMVPSNSIAGGCWGEAFANINTANGILEYGAAAGVDDAMLAEAHFFRAFDYFLLVQTYGGVPLDLGSGELRFNTSTSRYSVRNTVPEVYDAIFEDLEKAVNDLPETPRLTGTVTKNVARLYLAKAYLTYAWWLENPNNIPTYPECTRDASKAASYFQKAYDTALFAINNPGPYGLQPTFYDVNVATNDRNSETMLYADHNEDEKYGNGGSGYGWGSGGSPENFAYWMETWNYTEITALSSSGDKKVNPIQREAV
ncbi:MAG: RagB/SusD family nutrient uptake outer membrane protein, partial [Bacteroidales bacterium]|nr:RagB/SusD family nutrient uptake outer membrane protein [Bacteroidales bacterium]